MIIAEVTVKEGERILFSHDYKFEDNVNKNGSFSITRENKMLRQMRKVKKNLNDQFFLCSERRLVVNYKTESND